MSSLSGILTRSSLWCVGWRRIASGQARASTICATRHMLCISRRLCCGADLNRPCSRGVRRLDSGHRGSQCPRCDGEIDRKGVGRLRQSAGRRARDPVRNVPSMAGQRRIGSWHRRSAHLPSQYCASSITPDRETHRPISRAQAISPNYAWHSKCIAGSCSRDPLTPWTSGSGVARTPPPQLCLTTVRPT